MWPTTGNNRHKDCQNGKQRIAKIIMYYYGTEYTITHIYTEQTYSESTSAQHDRKAELLGCTWLSKIKTMFPIYFNARHKPVQYCFTQQWAASLQLSSSGYI